MKIAKNQRISNVLGQIICLFLTCTFLSNNPTFAQGEALYKAKCASCHQIEKNGTGPMLKGARQRWMDAGEGDLIVEWVQNNAKLRASGKSKRAATVFWAAETDCSQMRSCKAWVRSYSAMAAFTSGSTA